MSEPKFTNRLVDETSPYLLQHAHNPVDWFPWKAEAFEKAIREDKPILVSIGYSTCHWCHVMERESFEDEDVAAFMNEHFVCIKVDREERPDVDQIYMDTCQIMTGGGGWPLNCFLTPDKKPFLAGTYYPPRPAHGRASWIQVLHNIHHAFNDKRNEVEEQANRLVGYLQDMDKRFLGGELNQLDDHLPEGPTRMQDLFYQFRDQFDRVEGGFGSAPKFPGTMALQFLLRYHQITGNEEALKHVHLSLQKMIRGGIYDQIGGGFARYATDRAWLIPHFEKMLYDNALLIGLLAEAYQLTGEALYAETIRESLEYIDREMSHKQGGFFAAQDADSEGVEGKFFVWEMSEIQSILAKEKNLEAFLKFYGVTESGNWEHRNILWRPFSLKEFSEKEGLDRELLERDFRRMRNRLFEVRKDRIHPGLDDKMILSWNALMVSAYAKSAHALNEPAYKEKAINQLNVLCESFKKEENSLACWHTYKEGIGQYDAFLDDYAFLIQACLQAYTLNWDRSWLDKAKDYTDLVVEEFWNDTHGLFYYAGARQQDLIVRKSDLYDSATPSGNSTMLLNLQTLSHIFNEAGYQQLVDRMLGNMKASILKYPSSFANWSIGLLHAYAPPAEVLVIGTNFRELANQLKTQFIPEVLVLASDQEQKDWILTSNRYVESETLIYVCRNYTCQRPVGTMEEAVPLMAPQW
ncbi:MAG: thioredoxin domain-containing protein [Bacteroidota bacterium]